MDFLICNVSTTTFSLESTSSSLYFQWYTIGSSFTSSKYLYIRSTSSSLVFTRMPLSIWRVSLLKKPSTRFSHEPCFGVNTNSNLSGFDAKYLRVSSEECTLKLSNTKRILSNFGYLASSNLRNSIYSLLLCLSLTSGIWLFQLKSALFLTIQSTPFR